MGEKTLIIRYKLILSLAFVVSATAVNYAGDDLNSKPELFGEGVISTSEYELNASFSPDGNTFYFAKSAPDFSFWTLVESHLVDGKWTKPEILPFSGKYSDADPFMLSGGKVLFFISDRPINENDTASKDLDIWQVEYDLGHWLKPRRLSSVINSPQAEWFPCVTDNGTLYFTALREGGQGSYDIYRSRPAENGWGEPENLGDSINSKYAEIEAYVPPDESFIIFCSYNRPDGLGNSDMYVSFNNLGVWTAAKHLDAPINSSAEDRHMTVTPDGRYLVFTSTRGGWETPLEQKLNYSDYQKKLYSIYNGLGNIFQIEMDALFEK
ncbi:MAG TPA: hypothetical protein VHP63_01825 [candidate division Zixibacteria bacterium]|nr:hypothetical protein [candidate division Zixibacteria bacterium]